MKEKVKRIDLFKLFGFEIRIDLSWVVLAILVAWSLSAGLFPFRYEGLSTQTYWIMGIVGAIGLFFSIIIHEMSHSLVARQFGMPIKGITLFLFGGVADHFKKVNDQHGHGFGDVVLETLAERFVESLRPRDRVYRFGENVKKNLS